GKDRSVNTVLILANAISEQWLRDLSPDDLQTASRIFYDPATRRVYAEEQMKFRDLALGSRRVDPPPTDEAARLLTEEVLAGRLLLKEWDHGVDQWITRLNFLAQWCPEFGLPPIGEQERRHLVEQLCHGAFAYTDITE